MRVYRVQAADGRGPWRPGWSHVWIDEDAHVGMLTETIIDLLPLETLRALPRDRHYGTACRTVDQLARWFTPVERMRLADFGYFPVAIDVDAVLAESDRQLVFARRRALDSGVTRLSWSRLSEAQSAALEGAATKGQE